MTDKERIEQLKTQLRRHDWLYYVEARPEISDREYDLRMDELKALEAAHPDLVTPDSPTQRVGGEPIEGFASVRHRTPMLSIDNTYNEAEVREFDARIRRSLGDRPFHYVVDPKIDGLAMSIRYENCRYTLAATRGDGETGDDVTVNVRTIKSVPLSLTGKDVPDVVEARGEIYWPRKAFAACNAQRKAQGLPTFANPRNGAAGTLKQLDPKVVAQRGLAFFMHSLGEMSSLPSDSAYETMKTLASWGLPMNPHTRRCKNIDEVLVLIHEWLSRRTEVDYETDGMVVKVDEFSLRDELGQTSKYPRWCIAYKYEAQQATPILEKVTNYVGRTGVITPVAQFKPVPLSGTQVSNASLHNFDEIERLDVRIGDTIIVEKAGEIIPQVLGIILEARPQSAEPIVPPKACPDCASPLVWDQPRARYTPFRCKNPKCDQYLKRQQRINPPPKCVRCGGPVEIVDHLVDLLCVNPECPAQIERTLEHFCGRDQMDIRGFGPELIRQVIAERGVRHFADLYTLTSEKIKGLRTSSKIREGTEGIGIENASKLATAIQESKSRGLERLMAGLGVYSVGTSIAASLASQFASMDDLLAADKTQIRIALSKVSKVSMRLHEAIQRDRESDSWTTTSVEEYLNSLKRKPADGKKLVHILTKAQREVLSSQFPSKPDLAKASLADINAAITGIEPRIVADNLFDFLHSRSGSETIERLRNVGVSMASAGSPKEGPLSGKTVVLTGSLTSMSRSEATEAIKNAGGKVGSSVTGNTSFVIAGHDPGSKLDDARRLNVEVIDETEFLKRICAKAKASPDKTGRLFD